MGRKEGKGMDIKMKKSIRVCLCFCLAMSLFFGNSSIEQAAAAASDRNDASGKAYKTAVKTNVLAPNKVYFYDLDKDGKKEKIKYSFIEDDSSRQEKAEIILYINGKKKYKKKLDHALSAQYTIADIEEADGYLDLFLMVTSDSYCLEYAAFQRYQSNQIKTLTSSLSNKDLQFIRGFEIEGIDKKGGFKAAIDTPFYIQAMGCYFCYVPFVMKNGKVKQKKVSTYSLASHSEAFNYILKQEVKVYEKGSLSSRLLRTIKKGEYITISKIKLSVGRSDLKENVPISGYAYITDKDGKKGWIYLDKKYNWENPLFEEVPSWG